jgi:hypothetical protein
MSESAPLYEMVVRTPQDSDESDLLWKLILVIDSLEERIAALEKRLDI